MYKSDVLRSTLHISTHVYMNVPPMSLGQRSNNMSHRILRTCCSSLRTVKIYIVIYMLYDASTVHYASQAFRIVTGVFMDVQVNGNLRVPPHATAPKK